MRLMGRLSHMIRVRYASATRPPRKRGQLYFLYSKRPLLAVLCRSPFWHDWSSRMQTVVSTNAIGWSCAMQLRS